VLGVLRGKGGRIGLLPLAWKAATLVVLERMGDATGLLMAGKVGECFVVYALLVTALRHICLSIVGLIIEFILAIPDALPEEG
jgi:hypothetical protein